VSGGWAESIYVWDVAEGRQLGLLKGHKAAILCLAFRPDGKLLASGSLDNTVRLWELDTREEVRQIDDHDQQVNAVVFTRDGHGLITGSVDRTIRLWEASTGQEVRRFAGHQGPIFGLAVSDDGGRLASAGADGFALVFDLLEPTKLIQPKDAELSAAQLERFWNHLGSANPRQAYQAITRLASAPKQTMPFLKEKLTPFAEIASKERVSQLIDELNSDDFQKREQASKDLESLGDVIEPVITKALAGFLPSLEVRRRLERLMDKLNENRGKQTVEILRASRAIGLLESLGTDEAKGLLRKFAEGMPEAKLTLEAKAALDRLARRAEK
jgi:hypothetical protein